MSLKSWINQYVISLGPSDAAAPADTVNAGQVPLKAESPVSGLSTDVSEEGLRSASEANVSFEKIFELAQIPVPGHRYTVEKVGEMLQNPKLASLSKENRAAAILVALDAQGVKIEQVIEEAARKDKALDVFERVQREHLKKLAAEKEDENKKLQAEVDAFIREKQAVIDGNKKAVAEAEKTLNAWLTKKAMKEKELHGVVDNFTTDNPITIEGAREPSGDVKITDLTQTFKK